MKNALRCLFCMLVWGVSALCAGSEPDSLYLFSYFTNRDSNTHGMHYAWSRDGYEWHTVGAPLGFLRPDPESDAPRLRDPFIMQGKDGMWH